MGVLFTSMRELYRAENIRAVYDAYEGAKLFQQMSGYRKVRNDVLKRVSVMVTDEYPTCRAKTTIMISHGSGYAKTYGFDMPKPYINYGDEANLDYVVCSSTRLRDLTAKQHNVPVDHVLPLGLPRTDQYFGKRKGDGGTPLAEKRAYLYTPTFRSRGEGKLPTVDWQYLDDRLQDDEILVVKAHMVGKRILDRRYEHIKEASAQAPTAKLLIDCDVLITDYSSIVFDAHILQKPVVLFEQDSEKYLEKRGMYLDYPYGYASRHCRTTGELLEMLREARERKAEDDLCLELTMDACDGHSTERLISLIEETK